MALYESYLVTKSTIRIDAGPGTGDLPILVGILPTMTVGTSADSYYLREQARSVYKCSGGDNKNLEIRSSFDCGKVFAVTDTKDDSDLAGDASNNPAIQFYFHVYAAACALGIDPDAIPVVVTIEFDVLFRDRKDLSLS
jgi:hypothetical protein